MVGLETGAVLIGGEMEGSKNIDLLYLLAIGDDGQLGWNLMNKKLKTARSEHVAFLIDDCPNN